jgi:hypothetical protein
MKYEFLAVPCSPLRKCGEDHSKPYLGGSLNTLFIAGLEAGQTFARSSPGFGSPSTSGLWQTFSAAAFASPASTIRGSDLSETPLW